MKSTIMMKQPLCLLVLSISTLGAMQAHAGSCSAQKMQEILQPASKQNQFVQVDCDASLPAGAQITKQVQFAGSQSSGVTLDCQGATLQATYSKPSVLITSVLTDKGWDVPHDIQIRNCSIQYSLRIHGMAQLKQSDYIRESSYHEGHTQRAQQAAPHNIVLDHLNISSPSNMVYLSAGVHDVTLKNSRFSGTTDASALYLDAESANNIIENNTFDVQTLKREVIAIDGSANNVIRGNTFINPLHGGINLYRNCGEAAIVRHQTPSGNQITGNRFELGPNKDNLPVIWVASRNGNKKYCGFDSGYPFGSSINDNDLAENNTIADNVFVQPKSMFSLFQRSDKGGQDAAKQDDLIRVNAEPNQLLRNKVKN